MGAESSWIVQQVHYHLCHYTATSHSGLVLGPNCGCHIFPDDANRIRFPNGSFIRGGQLPNDVPPRGHMRVVPDVVIEVVSPNDLAWEVDVKVVEYQQAGVPLVWVFFPDTRSVSVSRSHGESARLGMGDTLSDAEILPSFTCPLAETFPRLPITPR